MTDRVHRELAAGRWYALTIHEQLGNIGSEVNRTLNWRSRNPSMVQPALERALEPIDLTLDDRRVRASVHRLRELCRVRGRFLDFVVGENRYRSTEAAIRRYFDVHALAARRAREHASRRRHHQARSTVVPLVTARPSAGNPAPSSTR